ncbi:MAG: hypothetical protein KME31_30685 [Tolypothrix carrinoi HA7290-LM1]|nr:hypothetical protein [Tolypothrix carrinoi HA7290-LM1]
MTFSLKTPVLTDSETLDEVIDYLIENISIQTQGAFEPKSLFEILIAWRSHFWKKFVIY